MCSGYQEANLPHAGVCFGADDEMWSSEVVPTGKRQRPGPSREGPGRNSNNVRAITRRGRA